MAHVVGHEGEQAEHRGGGQPVLEHIARTAVAAAEIDGQDDGDRERGGDARQPRHQYANDAVGSVVGVQAGHVGDHLEGGGHGVAGQGGRVRSAFEDRGGDVHRALLAWDALMPVRD